MKICDVRFSIDGTSALTLDPTANPVPRATIIEFPGSMRGDDAKQEHARLKQAKPQCMGFTVSQLRNGTVRGQALNLFTPLQTVLLAIACTGIASAIAFL